MKLPPSTLFLLPLALSSLPASAQWSQQFPTPTPTLLSVHARTALDVWFAGNVGADGALRHTTNGGSTWTDVELPGTEVASAYFLQGGAGVAVGDGIQHTTDNGQTWSAVDATLGLRHVTFQGPSVGWACGEGGAVRFTSDGGQTWTARDVAGFGSALERLAFVDVLEGWTSGAGGALFHTTDGGQSWSAQSSGTTADLTGLAFTGPLAGWAAGMGTVLRTSDGGVSWQATGFPAAGAPRSIVALTADFAFTAGAGGRIRETTDGGVSWTTRLAAPTPLFDIDFGDFFNGFATGMDGTVYRSVDGGLSWSLVAGGGGDPVPVFSGFDAVDDQRGFALSVIEGVYSTDDGGATWDLTNVGNLLTLWDIAFSDDGLHGYACGQKGSTFPTTAWTSNGGATWESTSPVSFYNLRTVAVADPLTAIAAGHTHVHRTENGGQTWTHIFPVPQPMSDFYGSDFADSTTGWIVGTRIFRTDDAGLTWAPQFTPSATLNGVEFADVSTGWAVGDNGLVLETTNGGTTWTQRFVGPGTPDLNAVSVVDANTLWVAGDDGFIASTTDSGATWQPEGPPGLAGKEIFSIDVDAFGRGWVSGYDGMGIWRREPAGCTTVNYCVSTLNSTGAGAMISATGSLSVAVNDLTLFAQPVPNEPGIFYYGASQIQMAFGDGFLCVGSPVSRLPVEFATGNVLMHDLDVTSTLPGFSITAGSTWNFQAWYRDPAAGGASFNLSDGLEATFCP